MVPDSVSAIVVPLDGSPFAESAVPKGKKNTGEQK